jgi:hypothetical protein
MGWRGNWIWCRRGNGSDSFVIFSDQKTEEMNQFSFRTFSSLGGKHSEMRTEMDQMFQGGFLMIYKKTFSEAETSFSSRFPTRINTNQKFRSISTRTGEHSYIPNRT